MYIRGMTEQENPWYIIYSIKLWFSFSFSIIIYNMYGDNELRISCVRNRVYKNF